MPTPPAEAQPDTPKARPARNSRLNPFAGLEQPRRVWAWGMYDLANQSFTLLIITLLFSLYVKEVVVPARVGADGTTGSEHGAWIWSLMQGGSLLLVVIVSPVLGAIADAGGLRKAFLIGTGVVCATLTCSLALVGAGDIWLAASLYVVANLCYQVGENFLASFLPDVSTPRTLGRVSATGWSMGYVGALLLLILTFAGMKIFNREDTTLWRPFFVFAGVWFLVGMIPAAMMLKESKPDRTTTRTEASGTSTSSTIVMTAFTRLVTTAKQASRFRQLVIFLLAFFIYAFGVQTVIAFASILATDFGFTDVKLVLFVAQITVTAGIAAIATAMFQDRIGVKNTVLIYLGVWIISCLGLVVLTANPTLPSGLLWVIGNGLGFGLGGIGTASRSMIARFTPKGRAAEFFGLWGMVYKLAGAIGVLSFGAVRTTLGPLGAMVLLTSFFVVGGIIMLGVNEIRGLRAARRSERMDSDALAAGNGYRPGPLDPV